MSSRHRSAALVALATPLVGVIGSVWLLVTGTGAAVLLVVAGLPVGVGAAVALYIRRTNRYRSGIESGFRDRRAMVLGERYHKITAAIDDLDTAHEEWKPPETALESVADELSERGIAVDEDRGTVSIESLDTATTLDEIERQHDSLDESIVAVTDSFGEYARRTARRFETIATAVDLQTEAPPDATPETISGCRSVSEQLVADRTALADELRSASEYGIPETATRSALGTAFATDSEEDTTEAHSGDTGVERDESVEDSDTEAVTGNGEDDSHEEAMPEQDDKPDVIAAPPAEADQTESTEPAREDRAEPSPAPEPALSGTENTEREEEKTEAVQSDQATGKQTQNGSEPGDQSETAAESADVGVRFDVFDLPTPTHPGLGERETDTETSTDTDVSTDTQTETKTEADAESETDADAEEKGEADAKEKRETETDAKAKTDPEIGPTTPEETGAAGETEATWDERETPGSTAGPSPEQPTDAPQAGDTETPATEEATQPDEPSSEPAKPPESVLSTLAVGDPESGPGDGERVDPVPTPVDTAPSTATEPNEQDCSDKESHKPTPGQTSDDADDQDEKQDDDSVETDPADSGDDGQPPGVSLLQPPEESSEATDEGATVDNQSAGETFAEDAEDDSPLTAGGQTTGTKSSDDTSDPPRILYTPDETPDTAESDDGDTEGFDETEADDTTAAEDDEHVLLGTNSANRSDDDANDDRDERADSEAENDSEPHAGRQDDADGTVLGLDETGSDNGDEETVLSADEPTPRTDAEDTDEGVLFDKGKEDDKEEDEATSEGETDDMDEHRADSEQTADDTEDSQ